MNPNVDPVTNPANPLIKAVLIVGLLLLLGLITLFIVTSKSSIGDKVASFSELGGDFTLHSSEGDITLSSFKGQVVVMYFGFLTCPEVCPNSMSVIARAVNKLGVEQAEDVKILLVSIDPKRDTLQKLKEYSEYFHPNMTGITGSVEEIDAVTRQYGAYYNYTEIESVTDEYGVEHSSRYYVINREGKLVDAMRHGTTANELTARLKLVL